MRRISKFLFSVILLIMSIGIAYVAIQQENIMLQLIYFAGAILTSVIGMLLFPKKDKGQEAFNKALASNSYYCEKCDGVSYQSFRCENGSCPNRPCCDKPKTDCRCFPEEHHIGK